MYVLHLVFVLNPQIKLEDIAVAQQVIRPYSYIPKSFLLPFDDPFPPFSPPPPPPPQKIHFIVTFGIFCYRCKYPQDLRSSFVSHMQDRNMQFFVNHCAFRKKKITHMRDIKKR